MLVDNFGIQVDTDIEFNGDECANLKWPVGYHHCRKHPHFYIVNSSLYVATQSRGRSRTSERGGAQCYMCAKCASKMFGHIPKINKPRPLIATIA